jgi:hypothetical protein
MRALEASALIRLNKHHFTQLELIMRECSKVDWLEGNCFYKHLTLEIDPTLKTKQQNILELAKGRKNILEIGFNAGHSCLLMLIVNPFCHITALDICEHTYVRKCFDYLSKEFEGRITLIEGDSTITLPLLVEQKQKYDLIHVDGGHATETAQSDFKNSIKLMTPTTMIILDDTDLIQLQAMWTDYTSQGIIEDCSTEYLPALHSIGKLATTFRSS